MWLSRILSLQSSYKLTVKGWPGQQYLKAQLGEDPLPNALTRSHIGQLLRLSARGLPQFLATQSSLWSSS